MSSALGRNAGCGKACQAWEEMLCCAVLWVTIPSVPCPRSSWNWTPTFSMQPQEMCHVQVDSQSRCKLWYKSCQDSNTGLCSAICCLMSCRPCIARRMHRCNLHQSQLKLACKCSRRLQGNSPTILIYFVTGWFGRCEPRLCLHTRIDLRA